MEAFQETTDEKVLARQQRIRDGIQWNRFYIHANEFLDQRECFVDLRRVTPLPAKYFMEAKKICSLGEDALFDLHAQMGVNQSGLQIYLEPVACQSCGATVDPKQFFVPSGDDVEEDID